MKNKIYNNIQNKNVIENIACMLLNRKTEKHIQEL